MSEMTMYQPKVKGRSVFIDFRGLNTHCHVWGDDSKPLVLMLHGWMDMGASFQFVVDHLKQDWFVVAPDLRGFGLSDWPVANGHLANRSYWFADYLGDLDAMVDHFSPEQPICLVGHSMGANIAMMYAGIRPNRVSHFVNLEGFGLLDAKPEKAGKRYARWLDELKSPPSFRKYDSLEEVAGRLQKTNYRLSTDKALFLAQHWSRQVEGGQFELLGDPAHRVGNPIGYRLNEAQAIWSAIEAPVLHIEAAQTEAGLWMSRQGEVADFDAIRARFDCVQNWRFELVDQAGHMLHHDQPAKLAELIEAHFAVAQSK